MIIVWKTCRQKHENMTVYIHVCMIVHWTRSIVYTNGWLGIMLYYVISTATRKVNSGAQNNAYKYIPIYLVA